ncbi:hypothetical protein NSQ62_07755 [Solibacillus sp. FSL H8-0523]|uniref:fibronectin type III domain-containing protein n=1 Tax=Solibacillus sp. FSL H8-0523 TaxID=2954511 RepID=UPI0031010CA0
MAYVSTISTTQSSITVDISDLGSRQNTYNQFRFRISSGSWRYVSVQSGYTGYDSPNYTFTGLSAGTAYYIEGEAQTNSWYSATPKWANTDSAPIVYPPSTPSMYTPTPNSQTAITFSWSGVSGATYYELYMGYPYYETRYIYQTYYQWLNLSPGTQYGAQVRAYDSSKGMYSDWSSMAYAYTNSPPPPPPTPQMYTPTVNSQSAITFSWSGSSGATYYDLYMGAPLYETRYIYQTYYQWLNLLHSTRYGAQVRAYSSNSGLYSSWSSMVYATTNSPPVTAAPTGFTLRASASTEVVASWNSVSGATNYEVAIYTPISVSYTTTSTSRAIGNLSPNTYYAGYVRAYSAAGGWSAWSGASAVTTPKSRPTDFNWTYAKNSGGNFNLTATEWNNLCVKINAFREYKGLGSYTFTTAITGQPFTYNHYNQARNAINSMNTNIPPYRNQNDTIYASEINQLRTSLNSIS